MKAEESVALIAYRLERSCESLDFSSPDREMVAEYLEKAKGFISTIQEYLRQKDK